MSRVVPAGASEDRASLVDFLPPLGQTVWLWLDQGAHHRILLRSVCTEEGPVRRWTEDRWLVSPRQEVRATERTLFELERGSFGEVARFREQGGPNVHAQVIRIPAQLALEAPTHPFPEPTATLTLSFVGPVAVGGQRTRALALSAAAGGQQRVQWMRAGFGEIWVGPPDGDPLRWAVGGWRSDGTAFGEPVPEALRTGPLPDLPPVGHGARPDADPFA